MHAAERFDHRPILHGDVAGEGDRVAELGMIAHFGVVRDVHIGHQEVVGADPRHQATALRAPMDGDELANLVAASDAGLRALALVLQILRRNTDRGVRIEDVVFADGGHAFHINVSHKTRVRSDFDIGADDAVGSDFRAVRDASLRIDDGSRMNRH